MILENKIAVVYKIISTGQVIEGLRTSKEFAVLQSVAGKTIVILEAWTMGRCISN